jgi:Fic family protein
MRPPYTITPVILNRIRSISEKIGAINAHLLDKQSPQLRKTNRIKTIHATLQIEGNTLTEAHVTALIENKKVIGPKKDVLEVTNAIQVYENLNKYSATSQKHFLQAHQLLMNGLVPRPGKYRTSSVGIVKGNKLEHLAPPHSNVPHLMSNLFKYLKTAQEITLIKCCVFHYEMEFIHPFTDGNGRMGRLWQTLILAEEYPIFYHLPLETIICQNQKAYYRALAICDKAGNSTAFIEYMLDVIDEALGQLLNFNHRIVSQEDRLNYFISLDINTFGRKDYLNIFKNISSATASRDLKKGLALGLFKSIGAMNATQYSIKKR